MAVDGHALDDAVLSLRLHGSVENAGARELLPTGLEESPMKYATLIFALIFAAGCEVNDRTGEVRPTAETQTATAEAAQESRDAAQQVKEGAEHLGHQIKEGAEQVRDSEAGQRVVEGAKEAGQGIKQGAGEAAEAAGETLTREGREAQAEAKATKKKQ
jgi:hypothetical protein